jgi:hypothetical protein
VIDVKICEGFFEMLSFHEIVLAQTGDQKFSILNLAAAVGVNDFDQKLSPLKGNLFFF